MKKVISITLVILLVVCLSACNMVTEKTNNDSDSTQNTDVNSESIIQEEKNEGKSSIPVSSDSDASSKEIVSKPTQKNNIVQKEQANNNEKAPNNENSSEIELPQNENNTTPSKPSPSKPSNEPEKHEHVYTTKVVVATCSSDGYTLNKCYCGAEYISNKTPKTYRHSFSKNTHPTLGESYVGNYLGSDKCSLCGLEVIDQGFWRDKNYNKSNVRYYFTNDTFVVYGSGTIPGNPTTNSSGENLAPWGDYINDNIEGFNNITKIIIADGITEISANSFRFPQNENNIKNIYISDSVKKIVNFSFSGFNKVIDVRLSQNLDYLGANFSSRDHSELINKTVLPSTLKYLSINAFYKSDWLWYEGTEEQFSKIKIIENQNLTVIEWINNNREAHSIHIRGVNYNYIFQ